MLMAFQKRLERHLPLKLDLVINDNKSTMLNLLEKKRGFAKISMHRMFLEAPDEVLIAISHYVRGPRRTCSVQKAILRRYIQDNLSKFPQELAKETLIQLGSTYHLQEIYDQINQDYFDNQINADITWYGRWGRCNKRRITFGMYLENLKLIRINQMLDDAVFPKFFVSFVVYHEMLHSVIPGYMDLAGRYRCHGKEFRARERCYADYDKALSWEKQYFKEWRYGRA